ncbi:RIKEN cDNA 2610042O14, isoform CRA_b [Mus musculus]|nr:RIKEN cDNA 2610042O14, isoform CRA_b [Mus musculus]EDL06388.1 RIKEN cDNA 2610042O14, isoform CRA_b [Mus musculus]
MDLLDFKNLPLEGAQDPRFCASLPFAFILHLTHVQSLFPGCSQGPLWMACRVHPLRLRNAPRLPSPEALPSQEAVGRSYSASLGRRVLRSMVLSVSAVSGGQCRGPVALRRFDPRAGRGYPGGRGTMAWWH